MITIDASIAIKWYKSNEKLYSEAVRLREDIINLEVQCCSPEWLSLEVMRGLKRNQAALGVSDRDIDELYQNIEDLFSSGVLLSVPVSLIKSQSARLINELNLYASDALYLAAAVHTKSNLLVTDDQHLLKNKVKYTAKKYGTRIVTLDRLK